MTFKEFKEKMVKKNRNMSILIKIFDVNSDGPWYEEGRGLTPYGRGWSERFHIRKMGY